MIKNPQKYGVDHDGDWELPDDSRDAYYRQADVDPLLDQLRTADRLLRSSYEGYPWTSLKEEIEAYLRTPGADGLYDYRVDMYVDGEVREVYPQQPGDDYFSMDHMNERLRSEVDRLHPQDSFCFYVRATDATHAVKLGRDRHREWLANPDLIPIPDWGAPVAGGGWVRKRVAQ